MKANHLLLECSQIEFLGRLISIASPCVASFATGFCEKGKANPKKSLKHRNKPTTVLLQRHSKSVQCGILNNTLFS